MRSLVSTNQHQEIKSRQHHRIMQYILREEVFLGACLEYKRLSSVWFFFADPWGNFGWRRMKERDWEAPQSIDLRVQEDQVSREEFPRLERLQPEEPSSSSPRKTSTSVRRFRKSKKKTILGNTFSLQFEKKSRRETDLLPLPTKRSLKEETRRQWTRENTWEVFPSSWQSQDHQESERRPSVSETQESTYKMTHKKSRRVRWFLPKYPYP